MAEKQRETYDLQMNIPEIWFMVISEVLKNHH